MTGDAEPQADDSRRGCVLLGNWLLIGLGVGFASLHVGAVVSAIDVGSDPEGWNRLGAWLLAIPSVLVATALAIASASRKVVPRPMRRIELVLVVVIVAGTVFEFLTLR